MTVLQQLTVAPQVILPANLNLTNGPSHCTTTCLYGQWLELHPREFVHQVFSPVTHNWEDC